MRRKNRHKWKNKQLHHKTLEYFFKNYLFFKKGERQKKRAELARMEALVTPAGFGHNHSQSKETFLVKSIDLLQVLRAAALQTEMSICSS